MNDFLSSNLFCACVTRRKRKRVANRPAECAFREAESDRPSLASSIQTHQSSDSHHIPGTGYTRQATSVGPELRVYNSRELRKRYHPEHGDRDIEYHHRVTRAAFASQDAFCSNYKSRRTGRYLRGILPTSMSRGVIGRYVFANDRPIGTHNYNKPKYSSIQEFFIKTSDSEYLHSYMFGQRNESAEYGILYLHGASGNIGYRVDVAKLLHIQLRADVLMIDYRGFGLSSGTPTELGVYLDAQAGFDYLVARRASRPDLTKQKLLVMGTSLGGAIALHLVSQEDNSALTEAAIIENCFTSVQDLTRIYSPDWAKSVIDLLGTPTMSPMFDLKEKVSSVICPLLYLVGRRDKVVPYGMTMTLMALSMNSRRKQVTEFEDGDHNDLPTFSNYCESILNFLTCTEEDIDAIEQQSLLDQGMSLSPSVSFDMGLNGFESEYRQSNASSLETQSTTEATAPPIPDYLRNYHAQNGSGPVRQYH
ncbi:hypothetical protein ACOME3_004075 [Neoechinorhynchus agilis]